MTKKYKFKKDGEVKEIPEERWGWGVIYEDGTELHQFDDDGVFHQFQEIEMDKVKMFAMNHLQDPNKWFYIPITDDIQFFHFYRNIRPAGREEFQKIYVFGYKFRGSNEYDEDGNVKSQHAVYHFILPDDKVITSPVEDIDLTKFGV